MRAGCGCLAWCWLLQSSWGFSVRPCCCCLGRCMLLQRLHARAALCYVAYMAYSWHESTVFSGLLFVLATARMRPASGIRSRAHIRFSKLVRSGSPVPTPKAMNMQHPCPSGCHGASVKRLVQPCHMGPHMGSVAIGVSSRPIHLHALVTLLTRLLRRLGRRCPSACSSSPAVCRLCAASCGWGISIAWLGCLLAAWGPRISIGGASRGLGGLRGEVQTLVHLLRMHRVQLRGLLQVRHRPGRIGALMGWPVEASRAAASWWTRAV